MKSSNHFLFLSTYLQHSKPQINQFFESYKQMQVTREMKTIANNQFKPVAHKHDLVYSVSGVGSQTIVFQIESGAFDVANSVTEAVDASSPFDVSVSSVSEVFKPHSEAFTAVSELIGAMKGDCRILLSFDSYRFKNPVVIAEISDLMRRHAINLEELA